MPALYQLTRAAGTTNEILNIYFQDNRNTSSIGMANISASSIAFSWCKDNQATQSSGVCSSQTVVGTYSTASLTQISSTSTLGWYQFGLHNGALAAGKSCVVKLWPLASTAGVTPVDIIIDLLGSIAPVGVSTMTTPVGVSSATVDFGVSTIAAAQKLVGVSTMASPVGVSSASVNLGVSTLATSVSSVTGDVQVSSYSRQVGVSSITVLVGASTLSVPVGVSSASVNFGVSTLATSVSSVTGSVAVSTMATPVGVSSASVNLGVSTIAVSEKLVGVSTIAVSEKLVGVSTITTTVGVSSISAAVGVSSFALPVGVSSFALPVGVSSSIMVSSNITQVNGVTIKGSGVVGDTWGPV